MDLVSVIVPVYKVEAYLDRCVRSIAAQTYSNLEIILVDDGSPDGCPALCDAWQKRDPRVKVIHQQNGGVSAARNTGLETATGDFILMVDSDDYIALEMVEILHSAARKHNADLVISNYTSGPDRDHVFSAVVTQEEELSPPEAMGRSYENTHNALRYIAPWGKLYRRSLFDGVRYPMGRIFEDIYVTHQLLWKCEKIISLDAVFTYYYLHNSSIMHGNFHLGKLDYLGALEQRIGFFEQKGCLELADIAYDEYLHSLIWEYSRVRDILHDKTAMKDLTTRFRAAYRPGHQSRRYPGETKLFLSAFYTNPELIVLYWRISSRLTQIFPRKGT